jgi:8-oxo-dGTP pyrophosphatase MutT (NUDIX family)
MTEPERIVRTCSRVLAISDRGRVLLLRGHDPARPQYAIWHAPGGGVEPGESAVETAVREFAEEIGVVIDIGPHVWNRVSRFSFNEVPYEQYEQYFLAEIGPEFEPSFVNMLDYERDWVTGHGWFSVEELREVEQRDLLAPPDLPERLADLLRDGVPSTPVDVGGEVLP